MIRDNLYIYIPSCEGEGWWMKMIIDGPTNHNIQDTSFYPFENYYGSQQKNPLNYNRFYKQDTSNIHCTCFNVKMNGNMSMVFSGYSGFIHQYNWTLRYNWNIVESGVKHHSSNPMFIVCIYFSAPPYNDYQYTQPSNYGPPPSYPGNQQYDIKSSWTQRGRLISHS